MGEICKGGVLDQNLITTCWFAIINVKSWGLSEVTKKSKMSEINECGAAFWVLVILLVIVSRACTMIVRLILRVFDID